MYSKINLKLDLFLADFKKKKIAQCSFYDRYLCILVSRQKLIFNRITIEFSDFCLTSDPFRQDEPKESIMFVNFGLFV